MTRIYYNNLLRAQELLTKFLRRPNLPELEENAAIKTLKEINHEIRAYKETSNVFSEELEG